MDFESGDHLALSASVERVVSLLGFDVAPVEASKSASQICWPPSRLLVKRTRLLSGENWRPSSPGWAPASLMGSPLLSEDGAIGCSQSSAVFVFWARSTVVTL